MEKEFVSIAILCSFILEGSWKDGSMFTISTETDKTIGLRTYKF
jgi:hypothetical protein